MGKVSHGERLDRSGIRRILVIATSWVGDAIMMLPALQALKEAFPQSKVTVMTKPWVLPLFRSHPAVDAVIHYPGERGPLEELREISRSAAQVRQGRYDLAVLFQNAFRAALLAFLGRVPHRVGYDTDGRGILLTQRVRRDREILSGHQVEYYLSLLRAMGWPAQGGPPRVRVSDEDRAEAERLVVSKGGIGDGFWIALGPGALFGSAKRWPVDRFARIGDWAVERWGARILLLGSLRDAGVCNELARAMVHAPVNLCGRTSLMQAFGVLAMARFFVTNDSGLMHAAAALGVPTVAVFGPTDANATGPTGSRVRLVRHAVPCAPCLKPECPTDHRCMLSIPPEEVWQAMEALKEESS